MSAKQHPERGITMEMNKTTELVCFDENVIATTVLEMLEIYIDSGESDHIYDLYRSLNDDFMIDCGNWSIFCQLVARLDNGESVRSILKEADAYDKSC